MPNTVDHPEELYVYPTGLGPRPGERILPLREAERRHLLAALKHTGGKIYGQNGAARLLDLKPTTLQSKLKKHGIHRLDAVRDHGPAEDSQSSPTGEVGQNTGGARPPCTMRPPQAAALPAE
jgi:Bacterial regulatory protein, Fis family